MKNLTFEEEDEMTGKKIEEEHLPGGLELKCHRCGRALPLLHPHIVVERYDEAGNMICEWCHEEGLQGKKDKK